MKSYNLKKFAAVSAFGLVALLGMTDIAAAQGNRRNDQKQERKIDKQQDKIAKQQAKIAEQRRKLEQERLDDRYRQNNVRNNNNSNRFRVNRNGSYYNTDQRGADLLRQAVNAGYQQGFNAGKSDRNGRRKSSWSTSNIYRTGTYGYQSYVDRNQYQYYFQQGFQKGYQDGYNSRFQYGSNNGGSVNILSSILGSILNIQNY